MDRARFLLDKYTVEEIIDVVEDPKKFGKLLVYDGMVLRRIAEAIQTNGVRSMDSLLDRLIGKPAQYIEQKIDQHTTLNIEERRRAAETEAEEMLRIASSKMKERESMEATQVH